LSGAWAVGGGGFNGGSGFSGGGDARVLRQPPWLDHLWRRLRRLTEKPEKERELSPLFSEVVGGHSFSFGGGEIIMRSSMRAESFQPRKLLFPFSSFFSSFSSFFPLCSKISHSRFLNEPFRRKLLFYAIFLLVLLKLVF
jgi:hypothetical protein